MKIYLLEVVLQLDGCMSLKEKRARLAPLRTLGKEPGIALLEATDQDVLQRSGWAFVLMAASAAQADRMSARVETFIGERVDGWIADFRRELL